MSLCCLMCLVFPIYGIAIMSSRAQTDFYLVGSISYGSVAWLSISHFHQFAQMMVMGMSLSQQYFHFMATGAVMVLLASITINKLAFAVFKTQHSENPHINENNFSNPSVRFSMALTFLQLLIYIITFVGVRYSWYTIYTCVFYLYPLLQVVFSLKKGGKGGFRWYDVRLICRYYQILFWIPISMVQVFIRGYHHNFLRLTPKIPESYGVVVFVLLMVS